MWNRDRTRPTARGVGGEDLRCESRSERQLLLPVMMENIKIVYFAAHWKQTEKRKDL